ncbi:MAG: hypothetical protein U9N04_02985 [Patescibacteria group bacterium]|nr:hypothetical protein [Patescibacteria group bacterium]
MIEYVFDILKYYGLTADKIGPAVFIGLAGWFLYKSLKDQIKDLDEDVKKLSEKVISIDNRVYYMEGRLEENYIKSASPMTLTEKGTEVLIESKAKEIVKMHKQEILNKILADPKPMNAYDAQEKTKEIIREMKDDSMFLSIKEYAFQKGINLYVILDIIAIYFRKFVLEELGFEIEDCDEE